MREVLAMLTAAAQQGATDVQARASDGSFLESTLEAAIADGLPGQTSRAQQRRRFPLAGYAPPPYGVDIEWTLDADVKVGIETKVADVPDSLFDVVKLATAVAHGHFAVGFCAVAATMPQWLRGGPVTAIVDAPNGAWSEWHIEELLVGPAKDAVLVAKGPRPRTVPARLRTMAAAPIMMPSAKTHILNIFGVTATAAELVALPDRASRER